MKTKTIKDIDVNGKKVLVRVDFNVPLSSKDPNDDIFVTDDFEHAHEVGVFLVAAQSLHLAVARDQEDRRRVGADMVQRRKRVDQRLRLGEPLLLAHRHVGNRVTAERNEAGNSIGVDVVFGQPAFVDSDHARQVSASRMA